MVNKVFLRTRSFTSENPILVFSLVVLIAFAVIVKEPLKLYPTFVDWKTVITLAGLLLITTGFKESSLFYLVAYRISRRINNERSLAIFLALAAALLAMFLTNDVALFIIVPLTLSLQENFGKDLAVMIIFEAIAVNVGSTLTAIGNPQNIFLWHQWAMSFPRYIEEMFPVVLVMGAWLVIFLVFIFPPKKISQCNRERPEVDRKLFLSSVMLFVPFIISVELGYEIFFFPLIVTYYVFTNKKVILKADWALIVLFIFIFIDLHLLCQLKAVQRMFTSLDFNNPHRLFFIGSLLSQFISNVPATIMLAKYSTNYKIIAYAVNIGGNGFLIASFANLIALNFVKNDSKYRLFHKYSIPFFILTLGSAYSLTMLL